MRLENELFESVKTLDDLGKDFSLEESLLIVSGIDSRDNLERYKDKITYLHSKYQKRLDKKDAPSRARTLIKFLGNGKGRYLAKSSSGESSPNNLVNVINRKIMKLKKIGNCIGLSSLGGVIGLREGLNLGCLFFTDHIALSLDSENKVINLETTIKGGYDCRYSKDKEWRLRNRLMKHETINSLFPISLANRALIKDNLRDLQKSIELYPNAVFYDWKSGLLENRRKMGLALESYKIATSLTNYPSLNYDFGSNLFNRRHYEEAVEQFSKAISLNPQHSGSYLLRGRVHFILGNYERALNDFIKSKNFGAIEYKKDAHFEMGRVYEKLGNLKKALKEYEKYSSYNDEYYKKVKKRIERLIKKVK
ncbi:MAG: tetratricopeptide repeat protein [archaeon]|nr:tetratricopeptide repeat protein [archaeon]